MKKKYFTNRKFTPDQYKVYVKNNNKIFEYTGEDNICLLYTSDAADED